jgi:diguanylate cyclase (GGDEF)-like protein/PAS domain S-box-containing protein
VVNRRPGRQTSADIADAIYRRRKALADLMHSPALGEGDIVDAVRQITEAATQILEVERASVWRLAEDGSAIECLDLYERTPDRHSQGARLHAVDCPRYFAALQSERAIAADDARLDPRTSEFTTGYLVPNAITAMLDAPVFVRGKMVGVVCHEHVGSTRTWEFFEELLAATFADFVAHVMETADWRRADLALRHERDALEGKVEERTTLLRESEGNLRVLLDLTPVTMVLTRAADHKVVFANRRAAAMFEVPIDRLIGQDAPDFWVMHDERQQFLGELLRHGRVDDMEVRLRAASGREFWARISAERLRHDGEDTLLAAIADVTDQKQTTERLSRLATHDALTGVFNRRHLEDVVRSELERAHRYQRPLTVAMVDADHFKRINDTYGHQVGDEVLRAVSGRCQHMLRTNDVLGRYGGEEFIVVFPETTLDEARIVAERVRSAIAGSPVTIGEHALEVTVSIGLAQLASGQEPSSLVASADAALYAAKQSGRNRVLTA